MPESLIDAVLGTRQLLVLTGAGISAPSGIPTYRDDHGDWRRSDPIQHQDFVGRESSRRRYWARSMAGWRYVRDAKPNAAHQALVRLERSRKVRMVVTQNVDRLHQRAGQRQVIDLHGRIDRVVCLGCRRSQTRADVQHQLNALNPAFRQRVEAVRPDGDAEVEDRFLDGFRVPVCPTCRGVLMPDVVFFGGTVPSARVNRVNASLEQADALLVVGSSLMVWSGFRFCRLAAQLGKPVWIVNRGRTRGDELATIKVEEDCVAVLQALVRRLESDAAPESTAAQGASTVSRGSAPMV